MEDNGLNTGVRSYVVMKISSSAIHACTLMSVSTISITVAGDNFEGIGRTHLDRPTIAVVDNFKSSATLTY